MSLRPTTPPLRRLAFVSCLVLSPLVRLGAAGVGEFENAIDVGRIARPGSSEYLSASGTYRITGSGANMWFKEDAFHFLHKRLSGDLSLTMDVAWPEEGREPHRKACAIVRAGLEADDVYVDVAVHGDGLIELQYRRSIPSPAAEIPDPSHPYS